VRDTQATVPRPFERVILDGVVTPLPYGVTITTPPATGVTFRAPYGELTLPAELEEDGLELELLAPGGQRHAVALVGVLGVVVRRGVQPERARAWVRVYGRRCPTPSAPDEWHHRRNSCLERGFIARTAVWTR
jgi:hypothetical protein